VVCGTLHAAVVAAIEVARRAIAPMSVRRLAGHRLARTRGPVVMWGIADPLVMCGLPRAGAGTALWRLTRVLQACYDRFTFTFPQNRVVLPNVVRFTSTHDTAKSIT
jgi:hypothetical protein